jgi:hypothetical protein
MARSRTRARRTESVQGGRNWDDDELVQCLSRPLGGVIPFVMVSIQSGHIFYTVTVALPQIVSRIAYEGSGSKVLACRTINRAWTTQRFKLSVEPGRYPSFASSAKCTAAQPRPKQGNK